nr:DHHA1 domain-containing protein [uncultured Sellimonas sp.]
MTKQLYNQDVYMKTFTGKVLSCRKEQDQDRYEVVLDQTAFFPEGGGQYGDVGWLSGTAVTDTQERDGEIIHYTKEPLEEGSLVEGVIDWKIRFSRMQQHTAEHILSGLVHKRFGYQNVGFHLGDDLCTMDFDGPVTKEEMEEMEQEANQAVYQNIPVQILYPSAEELETMEYRSKIEINGQVRIVWIPGYDRCACCATHVGNTGEIGQIKVIGLMNYKGGVRVTMVSGDRALADHEKREKDMKEISAMLSAKEDELPEAVKRLKDELESQKHQITELQRKMTVLKAQQIPEGTYSQCLFEEDLDQTGIRELMNHVLERGVTVCGVFLNRGEQQYQYVIGSREKDIRDLGKKLNERFQGRGGGKPGMIQGSLTGEEKEVKAFFEEIVNVE